MARSAMNRSKKVSLLSKVWLMLAVVTLATILLALLPPVAADAVAPRQPGFQDNVTISGLTNPTNVEFSKDGRIFVAEKSGVIKVFENLSDKTPIIFADLRTQVYNFWDRGLLGLALDPNFPAEPYVYVLYTYDAEIGGTAPRWGTSGSLSDPCPDPPGATTDGCVVSGRLSILTASGNTTTGPEKVLIEDWCQQYPSHTVGNLEFGADGALYVSGGEGAKFGTVDYGKNGGSSSGSPTPKNPCGDPPGGVGATLTPPTAEGGALRSQDLRTAGDPVTLDGAILRVDPATGAALPNNPLYGNPDPNAARIVSDGLRNPFRFALRPGTNEIWLGDVGWGDWEEINRVVNPTASTKTNFGWPCYEGTGRQPAYDAVDLNMCENLYNTTNAVTAPYFTYKHGNKVVPGDPGETCPSGSSSVSGLAFYEGGNYPAEYDNSLFFADYSRKCIWAMKKGTNGLPDPTSIVTFVADAASPVELEIGPGGDLFYPDLENGTVHRIRYSDPGANQPPEARATASPTSGPTPLTVNFSGTGSSDADGDPLSYAWDLDGDGVYDDNTSQNPTYTYSTAGNYEVGLKVTDSQGASDELDEPLLISAGNTPPTATINSPLSSTQWKVGDTISFSGSATDQQDGTLPASRLSWSLIAHHCYSDTDCHEHPLQDFPGVAQGSFAAPDHEYPSYLELSLTATDSRGLTDTKSVRLDPKTVVLTFKTEPAGLQLAVGSTESTAPFVRTVIVGSDNSISALSPQSLAGKSYTFTSWSDGGARSHDITASATPSTYTATYTPACTITGTSAANTLTGTSGPDVICGGGGNDTIKGLGGNDVLKGEAGGDKLYGGDGNDALEGGTGTDIIFYSSSPAAVTVSLDANTATGGEGSDSLVSIEKLTGSKFNDTLTGSALDNTINGGGGADSIDGLDGPDLLSSGGGIDTVRGGAGNDSVVGGAAADKLFGDEGDDTVDSRDGVSGNDSLDGGPHIQGDTALTDATEKSIVGFP
jgi:glucose/arabinose dehydrogenase/Ca2+-binding RTX toxin-like protein